MNHILVQNGSQGNMATVLTKNSCIRHPRKKNKVHTQIVPDFGKKTLQTIIRGTIEDQFAKGNKHINDIESFCSLAKRRRTRFHGFSQITFYLYLEKYELRFKNRNTGFYKWLLVLVKINLYPCKDFT